MLARTRYADPRKNKKNTSDHAYQSTSVRFLDANEKPVFCVAGSTWNLMNRCVSKEARYKKSNGKYNFKNNPWNIDETDKVFHERKQEQFRQIIDIIKSGPKDFIFLQEIDCLTFPRSLAEENRKAFISMRDEFISQLKGLGWNIILTDKTTGTRPFATLYNTRTLTHRKSTKCAGLDSAGFECEFLHNESNQQVTLVNLHLDYSKDYSQAIPAFQAAQVKADKFTIMGGDTNHAPNCAITGLINNWHNITNLEGDDLTGEISGKASNGATKCYDGFLVNPTRSTRADITETVAEVFVQNERSSKFVVRQLDPAQEYPKHCSHKTGVGMAWVRGGWAAYTSGVSSNQNASTKPAVTRASVPHSYGVSSHGILANKRVNPSTFQYLKVDFSVLNESDQADVIIRELIVTKGKVGITYSANHLQTESLADYYNQPNKKNWDNLMHHFSHSKGQGAVMRCVLTKLFNNSDKTLLSRFQILPISTMTYNGRNMVETKFEWLQGNLQNINNFVASGGCVIGWQNQLTKKNQCAIGGGVAAKVFNRDMQEYVQGYLAAIAQASKQGVPPPPVPTLETVSLISSIRKYLVALREPAILYKERRGDKVAVLTCALKCLKNEATLADLEVVKVRHPGWDKATGTSKVSVLVRDATRILDPDNAQVKPNKGSGPNCF
tara:strand:+ start:221 stop:2221 length:2001 start_codon:yes stop_codon:yes gene_type:complete